MVLERCQDDLNQVVVSFVVTHTGQYQPPILVPINRDIAARCSIKWTIRLYTFPGAVLTHAYMNTPKREEID